MRNMTLSTLKRVVSQRQNLFRNESRRQSTLVYSSKNSVQVTELRQFFAILLSCNRNKRESTGPGIVGGWTLGKRASQKKLGVLCGH